MTTQHLIRFDGPKATRLVEAYELCVERKDDQFMFEGVVFHAGYAKYVIEYLTMKGILK